MAKRLVRPSQLGRTLERSWPRHLDVDGLFREDLHRELEIHLDDRVTILTGPNGSGKTRLLVILRAALALDWPALATEPFGSMRLAFADNAQFQLVRNSGGNSVYIEAFVKRARRTAECQITLSLDPTAHLALPDYIVRVGEDMWEDIRDGELLDLEDLNTRFRNRPGYSTDRPEWQVTTSSLESLSKLREVLGRTPAPTLIETRRLDVTSRRSNPRRRPSRNERIYDYVDQIQAEVQSARAEYSRISQVADSQFASRALVNSKDTPPTVAELRAQFNNLAALQTEFLATGLVAETPNVTLRPGSLTKAERRIFAVFLDDWRRKLDPLRPVHAKLQMLQQIVGQKLKDKRLRLDEQARLRVETLEGTQIPVDQLSSGEQHLLALFAMLLFDAKSGSVVLIDEPEISLHAEWKHAFLEDIRKVAVSANLQFILATHSTAIINGQWELVEHL